MGINYSMTEDVGRLVIDHGSGNRIDAAFIEGLAHAATEAARSPARSILITSSGPDFCGGGAPALFADKSSNEVRAVVREIEQAFQLVESIPVPTVAAVQGRAWGGGLELALRADFLLADEDARFRFPEATIGVLPLAGGAQRVAARIGAVAATRLVLLADEVPAADLDAAGLLEMIPRGTLTGRADTLAARLASGPTQAYAGTKAILAAWARHGMAAADEVMVDRATALFATEDVALAATGSSVFVGR